MNKLTLTSQQISTSEEIHLCDSERIFMVLVELNHYFRYCLSNRKFERLDGPLDEIVTVSAHNYSVIMLRRNMTSFDSRDRLPRRWLLHFW